LPERSVEANPPAAEAPSADAMREACAASIR
jgi:hypothetical protein